MSPRREQVLGVAIAAVFCLLCGCGTEAEKSAENAAGTGTAGTGGNNAGTGAGGAASGGGTPTGGNSGAAGNAGAAQLGGMSHGGSGGTAAAAQGGGTFTLTSPALDDVAGCSVEKPSACDVFPDENVSYMGRANISPELRWSGAPAGTQSFAIVLLDATFGQAHWVMWNIPASVTMVAANVPQDTATLASPAGARQTNANFAPEGSDGYYGPHIPCNVFQFQLYALSSSTFSPMNPQTAGLVQIELQDLGEPVLGIAKLTGRSNDYMMTCE